MASLGCHLDTPGQREPQLKNCIHHLGLWVCLWGVFLFANWQRRAQLTVSSGLPGQVGLNYRRKWNVNLKARQETAFLYYYGSCYLKT